MKGTYKGKVNQRQYESIVETVWLADKDYASAQFSGQQHWYKFGEHPETMVDITVNVDEFGCKVGNLLSKLGFEFVGEGS